MAKKILLRILVALVSLVLLAGLAVAAQILYLHFTQPQMYADPVFDTEPPSLPAFVHSQRILVFSKTNGFRHAEAIPSANTLLQQLAKTHAWDIYLTENSAVFNPVQLAQFRLVVWNNASGPVLLPAQQQAFQHWLEQGGSYLGIHAAGGDMKYDWQWYVNEVLRAQFVMHPLAHHLQSVRVNVEMPTHPVMQGVTSWLHTDEWYNFKQSPRARVSVLASLDESTYYPEIGAMGADHPIIWCHSVGSGRVVYSALGHSAEAYDDPAYQRILDNAMQWLMVD